MNELNIRTARPIRITVTRRFSLPENKYRTMRDFTILHLLLLHTVVRQRS